jgi:hypothetical protein
MPSLHVLANEFIDAELHVPDPAFVVVAFEVNPGPVFGDRARFLQHKPVGRWSARHPRIDDHAVTALRMFERKIVSGNPTLCVGFVCQAPAEEADNFISLQNEAVVIAQDLTKQSACPMSERKAGKLLVVEEEADCDTERRMWIFHPDSAERRLSMI